MKTLTSILVIFTLSLGSGAVLAGDKCGKDDRVKLPSCATWKRVEVDGEWVDRATNNCSETITVKFDITSGKTDKRYDIAPGNHEDVDTSSGSAVRSVTCCPRYNRCDFGG